MWASMVWVPTFTAFSRTCHTQNLSSFCMEYSEKECLCEFFCCCDVLDAYENARFLCEQYYATAPSCVIECHDRKLSLCYCTVSFTHVYSAQ